LVPWRLRPARVEQPIGFDQQEFAPTVGGATMQASGRLGGAMTTMRVAARMLLAGAALLGLCFTPLAGAHGAQGKAKKGAYGAIAFHRDSGSYGYSYDFRSSREAKTEALKQCNHPQCEVALGFRSACAALANGPKKSGAVTGTTRQEAEAKALRKCGDTGCVVVAWACTK